MSYGHSFKKVAAFTAANKGRGVWTDHIEDGYRHIYVRCAGCSGIFEIGEESGTVITGLKIDRQGVVFPCLICPHCDTHIFAVLEGYGKTDVPDIFGDCKKRRELY